MLALIYVSPFYIQVIPQKMYTHFNRSILQGKCTLINIAFIITQSVYIHFLGHSIVVGHLIPICVMCLFKYVAQFSFRLLASH